MSSKCLSGKNGSSVGDSTVSTHIPPHKKNDGFFDRDEPWRVDSDLGRCWFNMGNLTVFNHIGLVNQE